MVIDSKLNRPSILRRAIYDCIGIFVALNLPWWLALFMLLLGVILYPSWKEGFLISICAGLTMTHGDLFGNFSKIYLYSAWGFIIGFGVIYYISSFVRRQMR